MEHFGKLEVLETSVALHVIIQVLHVELQNQKVSLCSTASSLKG